MAVSIANTSFALIENGPSSSMFTNWLSARGPALFLSGSGFRIYQVDEPKLIEAWTGVLKRHPNMQQILSSNLTKLGGFAKLGGWATATVSTGIDLYQAYTLTESGSSKVGLAWEKVGVNGAFTAILFVPVVGWGVSGAYFLGSQFHSSDKNPYGMWSIIGQGVAREFERTRNIVRVQGWGKFNMNN